MIRQTAILSLAALMASSCVTTPVVLQNGDNVALGQAANVGGPVIRPVRVLEDSRCPINARCIRAGDVRVLVEIVQPRGKSAVEVSLTHSAQIADGELTLTNVNPNRGMTNSPGPKPGDYRFSFKFDGGL
jgi:hypothetical protein